MVNPAGRHFLQIPEPSNVPDRVFRSGHLGDFNDPTLIGTLGGVEMGLANAGVAFNKGGVDAALDYLADNP